MKQGVTGPSNHKKMKNNKSREKSKIEAVEAVVNHQDLDTDRDINRIKKVLTKARVCWTKVDELRYQYEVLLDEAFGVLGESIAELMAKLATNDKRNEWIESVD